MQLQVVDMFGSGLPVCALAYSCISELVEDGKTGLLFSSPTQLGDQLAQLLRGFPGSPSPLLRHLQECVQRQQSSLRWEQNWQQVAWPVLRTGLD
jgi:beta-1,4-mannosyltransferase